MILLKSDAVTDLWENLCPKETQSLSISTYKRGEEEVEGEGGSNR